MKLLLVFLLTLPVVNSVPVDGGVVIVDTPVKGQGDGFDSFFRVEDDDDDTPFGWSPMTGFPFGFNENPFWKRFQDVMQNFQKQMNTVFNNPNLDESPGVFSNLPPNYHNSTSETKNVNGTIITVNQTIDTHKDNNSQSVFHIKIVQVRPPKPSNETGDKDLPGNVVPEANPVENVTPEDNSVKTPTEKTDDEHSTQSIENNEA